MAKKTKHRGKRGRKKGYRHAPKTLNKIRKAAKSRYKRSKLYKINQKRKAAAQKRKHRKHGRRKSQHRKYRRGIIGGTYLARGRARRPKGRRKGRR